MTSTAASVFLALVLPHRLPPLPPRAGQGLVFWLSQRLQKAIPQLPAAKSLEASVDVPEEVRRDAAAFGGLIPGGNPGAGGNKDFFGLCSDRNPKLP